MARSLTFLATVDELACVDAFSSDEELSPLLKPVRVPERYLGQRGPASGIMNNILVKS